MKWKFWEQALDQKRDWYIESLTSTLKMQNDVINELRINNQYLRAQLELREKAEQSPRTEANPSDQSTVNFAPLREGVELPSEKRRRLEKKYHDKAEAKKALKENVQ